MTFEGTVYCGNTTARADVILSLTFLNTVSLI